MDLLMKIATGSPKLLTDETVIGTRTRKARSIIECVAFLGGKPRPRRQILPPRLKETLLTWLL